MMKWQWRGCGDGAGQGLQCWEAAILQGNASTPVKGWREEPAFDDASNNSLLMQINGQIENNLHSEQIMLARCEAPCNTARIAQVRAQPQQIQATTMQQSMNQTTAKAGAARDAMLFAFADSLLASVLRDESLRSTLFLDLASTDTCTCFIRGGNKPS